MIIGKVLFQKKILKLKKQKFQSNNKKNKVDLKEKHKLMWRNSINYEDVFSIYKPKYIGTIAPKRESFKMQIPQDIIIEIERHKESAIHNEGKLNGYRFPFKIKTTKLNKEMLKPMMHIENIFPFKLETK